MKKEIFRLALLGLVVVSLAGCCTGRAAHASNPPADVPSQWTNIVFQEVIGSVPVEGAHQVYQNLHVDLAAVFNPRKPSGCNLHRTAELICRLEPPVAAQVLQVLTDGPTLSPHKLDRLREAIATKAQNTANEILAKWPGAADFDVEVLITSMYWTDSSVGRVDRAGPPR